MNFFELWRNAFANWMQANLHRSKTNKSRWRQYRHHAVQTDYVPAPRKGWHYERGRLVANRSRA